MHFLALAITALAVACTLISAFPINGPCILSFLSFDLPFPSINHHDHRKYFNNTLQWIGPDSNGVNITLYGKANEVLSQLSTIDASYIENTTLTPDAHHTSRSTISPAYDKYNIKCCPVAGENFSPQNITSVRTATNDVVRLAKKFRMVTAPPPPPSEGEEKTKAGCYTVTASSGAAVVICYNVSLVLRILFEVISALSLLMYNIGRRKIIR